MIPEHDSPSNPLVVIFGGAGYIGSPLSRQLLEEGYRVRVFDNLLYGDHGLHNLEQEGFEFVHGDICDTKAVTSAFRGAETVILLSTLAGRRFRNEKNNEEMRTINLLASSVVVDAAVEHGAERFIFASTEAVYGAQSGIMYETTTPSPVSLYARLKLRMEERVLAAKKREFHPVCLRLPTCYGYSERMRFDLLPNTFIRDAVYRKKINVISGEQWRPMLHVEDAARAFLSCVKAHANLVNGEIFNVGDKDQNYQVKQVAQIVKNTVPETEVIVEEETPDLVDYNLSCTKISKVLDFAPALSLEDSMARLRDLLSSGSFGNAYSLKYQNN